MYGVYGVCIYIYIYVYDRYSVSLYMLSYPLPVSPGHWCDQLFLAAPEAADEDLQDQAARICVGYGSLVNKNQDSERK